MSHRNRGGCVCASLLLATATFAQTNQVTRTRDDKSGIVNLAVQAVQLAGKLLAVAARLLERNPRFVTDPVGIILEPSQRPIDAGRADLEPEAALDRVLAVEPVGQAARDGLAIGEIELARVGPLGHHLQGRIGRAADHRHAHELVAEAFHLGLDPAGETRNVGHMNSIELKRLSDRSLGPQPRASDDVEERPAI